MSLLTGTIRSSPFVGVLAFANNKHCLVPKKITLKEHKGLEEALEVEVFQIEIGESSLIGALSVGNSKKFMVSGITTDEELEDLKKLGIRAVRVPGNSALGNLVCVNDHGLLMSSLLSEKEKELIEKTFDLPTAELTFGENFLVGSSIVANNHGFVINPGVDEKEFEIVEKILKAPGLPATANYGDRFVRNSLVANEKGGLAGINSSGIELTKIDDAFDSFRKR